MKGCDFPLRLFVTGTDTGVGKTVVCAVLMAGLKGVYWKPVQSGAVEGTDTAFGPATTAVVTDASPACLTPRCRPTWPRKWRAERSMLTASRCRRQTRTGP